MSITDHRQAAEDHIRDLINLLAAAPQREALRPMMDECESLIGAIQAFHLEGIRFRMFNVERLLTRANLPVPETVTIAFTDARRELEAAGFHTRSHQAPT
jgi:hypothetical protein